MDSNALFGSREDYEVGVVQLERRLAKARSLALNLQGAALETNQEFQRLLREILALAEDYKRDNPHEFRD
jgi:hypothetical protein